jgi:hypothetical protein
MPQGLPEILLEKASKPIRGELHLQSPIPKAD